MSATDDGVPWCPQCRSWHDRPLTLKHWALLRCKAPPPIQPTKPTMKLTIFTICSDTQNGQEVQSFLDKETYIKARKQIILNALPNEGTEDIGHRDSVSKIRGLVADAPIEEAWDEFRESGFSDFLDTYIFAENEIDIPTPTVTFEAIVSQTYETLMAAETLSSPAAKQAAFISAVIDHPDAYREFRARGGQLDLS